MSDAVDQKLEALTRRLDELEARDAIVQGLFRYARAVDRSDRALLKTCYHPDAIDVHWIFNGNAMEFADYIIPQMGASRSVRHCISNPMIDLDGDRAFVESQYWSVLRVDLPEKGEGVYVEREGYGRYLDIWEKRGGEWRIAHRHLCNDGTFEKLVTDQPAPEFNAVRTGQPAPNDPVYLGFAIKQLNPPPYRNDTYSDALREKWLSR